MLGSAGTVHAFWDFGKFVDDVKARFQPTVHENPAVQTNHAPVIDKVENIQAQEPARVNLAKKAGLLGRLALIGKDNECRENGGTWWWEEARIGCDGVDASYGCDQFLVRKAHDKCLGYGASFVCNETGIYCAYI